MITGDFNFFLGISLFSIGEFMLIKNEDRHGYLVPGYAWGSLLWLILPVGVCVVIWVCVYIFFSWLL